MGLETDRNLSIDFALHTPASLAEALELRHVHDDTVVMSGGQSLTVLLTLGFAIPEHVISIGGCTGLDRVQFDGTSLEIGALTTVTGLLDDQRIADQVPLLHDAASSIGSPHVRNFGTIVGNVCHADPGGDLVGPLICLDANIHLASIDGTRIMLLDDFVTGAYSTEIRDDEIAVAVSFPDPGGGWCHRYEKVARRQGDLALASVSVMLKAEGHVVADARLAIGGLLARAHRLPQVEQWLRGRRLDEITEFTHALDPLADFQPDLLVDPDDLGSADFLRELGRSIVISAIRDTVTHLEEDT